MPANLYLHFPFCRRKCSYCALYSRTGVSRADRDASVGRLAKEISALEVSRLKTVYFGGGSPALCNLAPLKSALSPLIPVPCSPFPPCEFTVELHPLDVTDAKLAELKELGVNRISMGVQSFDDATLEAMGRGYTLEEAARAFAHVKRFFDNAGIDLIVGYPGERVEKRGGGEAWREGLFRFCEMGMRHCSVYSLQNERGLKGVPDDDTVLDGIRAAAGVLKEAGLERYEISNYAVPGYECRHNLAVWRGEDYIGLGEGAYGRIGLRRTVGRKIGYEESVVTAEEDEKERTIFRLRTREGLDASNHPTWGQALNKFVEEGLLTRFNSTYRLTDRGTEVCDAILEELV